ncbi:putative cytokinetic ring protein SteA [Marinisporobacter balticus]|uniref:Putative membrane-anchored protein n=1 Tax=Marinisporobacter balticus TaxID=2018667 RepID=A0A4R2LKG9_9FIRM|nr:putative cytokinetic ring protein SteA [Marinisporobacter balticus]TCO79875.1 putative membrane-anchored protein [Marinisporobacter balticus]
MLTKAIARVDKRTKELVNRLNSGEIAVINHEDLDEVAANSLVMRKPVMVINAAQSISGRYPNLGPEILEKAGIPILDHVGEAIFNRINEADILEIKGNEIYIREQNIGAGTILTNELIKKKLEETSENFQFELDKFIENTLEYAKKEKDMILGNLKIPEVETKFKERHTLVVVRGKNYKEDLHAIKSYIEEFNPILIGVDGGGDALMECGYIPDIIVGDMDSVSDECLKACKEIVVHAYTNGKAPGLERIEELGLKSVVFPAPGTSEDIAMLLAFENKTELIVAVGTHSSMVDFLEKGRKGMASTFLVRLKVGAKLIDAKGVNKLYGESVKFKHFVGLAVGAMIPIFIVGALSPTVQQLLKLFVIKLKFVFPMEFLGRYHIW